MTVAIVVAAEEDFVVFMTEGVTTAIARDDRGDDGSECHGYPQKERRTQG